MHGLLPCSFLSQVGTPAKTEKVLSALARGDVWVVDRYFLEERGAAPGMEDAHDVGGRGLFVPTAAERLGRWERGGRGPFGGWVAAVALGEGERRAAYERILRHGGAKVVLGLGTTHLGAHLTHVVTEPMQEDDNNDDRLAQAVRKAASGGGVKVISYLYIAECLVKVSLDVCALQMTI